MNGFLVKRVLRKRSVRAFFCYARVDRDTVHSLYMRLRKDSVDVWLDKENLQPGQNWQHEIREAILKSDVVIVCISRGFDKQHGYRHEELKIALEKARSFADDEIFIIPARLEKCEMPESLRHLHRVDLFEPGGYKNLIHTLRDHILSK